MTIATMSEAWTVFTRSNATVVGSSPIRVTDVFVCVCVCVCVYSVFVLSCV
jgi:hypothetical protein